MVLKLSKKDVAFMQQLPVCRLATATEECEPIVRPVWPVFDGLNIYIASDPDTPKLEQIEANPEVSLVFDDYDRDNWSIIKASAFKEKQELCGMAKNIVMPMTSSKKNTRNTKLKKAGGKKATYP